MAYKKLNVDAPHDVSRTTQSFLERNKFVTRCVTHTASDLNPDHEKLMEIFRKQLLDLVQVCGHFLGQTY